MPLPMGVGRRAATGGSSFGQGCRPCHPRLSLPAMEDVMATLNPSDELRSPHSLGAILARNWWAIAIRGALGILFGLVALFLPGATMLSLVLLFAAYMLVDGVF